MQVLIPDIFQRALGSLRQWQYPCSISSHVAYVVIGKLSKIVLLPHEPHHCCIILEDESSFYPCWSDLIGLPAWTNYNSIQSTRSVTYHDWTSLWLISLFFIVQIVAPSFEVLSTFLPVALFRFCCSTPISPDDNLLQFLSQVSHTGEPFAFDETRQIVILSSSWHHFAGPDHCCFDLSVAGRVLLVHRAMFSLWKRKRLFSHSYSCCTVKIFKTVPLPTRWEESHSPILNQQSSYSYMKKRKQVMPSLVALKFFPIFRPQKWKYLRPSIIQKSP